MIAWLEVGTGFTYPGSSVVYVVDWSSVHCFGVLLGVFSAARLFVFYNEDGSFPSIPFVVWAPLVASSDVSQFLFLCFRLFGVVYLLFRLLFGLAFHPIFVLYYVFSSCDCFVYVFSTSYFFAICVLVSFHCHLSNSYILDMTLFCKTGFVLLVIVGLFCWVYQQYKWGDSFFERRNFAIVYILAADVGSGVFGVSGDEAVESPAFFVLGVNCVFFAQYFLSAPFCAAGWCIFVPGNRWGCFSFFCFGWWISRGNLLDSAGVIHDFTLGGGCGLVGNAVFFPYLFFGGVCRGGIFGICGLVVPGTYSVSIAIGFFFLYGSEDLRVGFAFSLVHLCIHFTGVAFINDTLAFFLNVPVGGSPVFGDGFQNFGLLGYTGVLFYVSIISFIGEFSWQSFFFFWFTRIAVVALVGPEVFVGCFVGRFGVGLVCVGEAVCFFFGYVCGGFAAVVWFFFYIVGNVVSPFEASGVYGSIIVVFTSDFFSGFTGGFSSPCFGFAVFFQGSYGYGIFFVSGVGIGVLIVSSCP
ncbi:hypothetical protein SAMN05660776_2589 [Salegentibacter holothuriorum]|uniref:Uncharacterized protein n=1 Tax=Salegentibacter holothuriorum TaxID=241145 RepID=A0A1T5DFI5_9FLAO|nr:hypothetical protein SAMN05660776_2589 [Salegentibacter holothuriorum]